MKILSANFNQNIPERYKIISRPVLEAPKDTFVKSNPSFHGAEKQAVTAGAKTLLELSAFLTAGFVTFKKLTGGNDDLKDVNIDEHSNPFSDFFNKLMGQKDDRIKALEEENDKLKQENSDLKSKLDAANTNAAITEETAGVPESAEAESDEKSEEKPGDSSSTSPIEDAPKQYVKFPVRRGTLSAEQKSLKNTVTQISITPEYNEKLTAICRDMLSKGAKDKENNERMLNLCSELENCNGDTEQLKAVVDKYEVKSETNENGKQSETEVNSNGNNISGQDNEQDASNNNGNTAEIYDPVAQRRLKGPTTVGTLDLSTVPSGRKKRPRIQQGEFAGSSIQATGNTETAKDRGTAAAISDEQSASSEFSSGIITSGVYTCSKPGTVPKEAKRNLTDALKFFEDKFLAEKRQEAEAKGEKTEYIKWNYQPPVGYIRKSDILNEIDKCADNDDERSRYLNITRQNVEFVKDAINEDSRIQGLFTPHGAVKFVERFVNFNNEDMSIEDQTSHAFDVLERTLQRGLEYGVTLEEHDHVYSQFDKDGNVIRTDIFKGANITIPPECYDKEAKKLFGSYPVKLGICRSRKSNQALICTVFSKDRF